MASSVVGMTRRARMSGNGSADRSSIFSSSQALTTLRDEMPISAKHHDSLGAGWPSDAALKCRKVRSGAVDASISAQRFVALSNKDGFPPLSTFRFGGGRLGFRDLAIWQTSSDTS